MIHSNFGAYNGKRFSNSSERRLLRIRKRLDPDASQLIRRKVDQFESSLLRKAKHAANMRKDKTIVTSHVNEVLQSMTPKRSSKLGSLLISIGGILLGVCFQEIATILPKEQSAISLFSSVLGMVGVALMASGYWRQNVS